MVILTYYHRQAPAPMLPLDKKRWQIEPFSKIQKESLKVVGVIVTHAKVVKAQAGTVMKLPAASCGVSEN